MGERGEGRPGEGLREWGRKEGMGRELRGVVGGRQGRERKS